MGIAAKRKTCSSVNREPERVGVIVPVRGRAPFLGEALESIVGQDPPPADVVVVDDASAEPVTVPPEATGRCRMVRREARGGPAGARQSGLEALRTPLVALCDSDDAWEPGKLAAQLDALERHPEAALCFGRAVVVGPDGAPTGERWHEPAAGVHRADDLRLELYRADPIPTSSVVARRDAVERVGGFASDLPYGVEDWDLWLRLVSAGAAFVCEPAARVRYRRHPAGLTADLENLAAGSLAIHERHAALASTMVRDAAHARDLVTMARGRVRRRDYAGARASLRAAASHADLPPRERALALLLAVPGLRGALGRRSPYPAARS